MHLHGNVLGVTRRRDGSIAGETFLNRETGRRPFYHGVAIVAALLGTAVQPAQSQETIDVFFLGNSYIYYNNLPDQLEGLAASLSGGPDIRTAYHLHGGFSLQRHLTDGHLPQAILSQAPESGFDIVVLQEQSRLGTAYADDEAGTIGAPDAFFSAGARAIRMAEEVGAEPLLYMTWAKEVFPGQTEALASAYEALGASHDAGVAPAGRAWARVRNERPDLQLFHPDGSHTSAMGTYLVACVMYATITGRSPVGAATRLGGLPMQTPGVVVSDEEVTLVELDTATAEYLQNVAWDVVRDG